jgi:hypothetical protein
MPYMIGLVSLLSKFRTLFHATPLGRRAQRWSRKCKINCAWKSQLFRTPLQTGSACQRRLRAITGTRHDETFKLPRAVLRDPMMMFFFASSSNVAVVSVPSLAREAYSILAAAQRTAPSAKDHRTMAALRVLDPSIAK